MNRCEIAPQSEGRILNKLPRKTNPFVLIDCTREKQNAVAQDKKQSLKSGIQLPGFEEEVGYIGETPVLARLPDNESR
jgi:hypothetical protein